MDFSNRNTQAAPAPAAGHTAPSPTAAKRGGSSDGNKLNRVLTVVIALALAVLLVFVGIIAFTANSNNNGEDKYVDTSKLQAVFLNTGQVYFGKISTLNDKYFVVKDIYYLQTSSGSTASTTATANTSVSLVKLGCELHEPYDQMVINRAQVTFWENLQTNGQVAKAVATFQQQNPNGQKCSDQSASSGSTSSNVQNAGTSTPTTGSTTTTTKP